MNYFAYPTAAERYAKARPFFHLLVTDKIRTVCYKGGRTKRALDVGCGTGQSSQALLEVSDEVVGVDNSSEMLSQALQHAGIRYIRAQAEKLPFGDATFELITVALAFHWFDRQKFLHEARRVLQPGGWLVIYNDGFSGRMIGNDNYENWNREHYCVRYPAPPRNNQPLTDVDALGYGFVPSGSDQFIHEVEFTPDQLVNYLLTQTNVISAVESGTEDLQSVAGWLRDSARPLFTKTSESFPFSCKIQFLKRG